MQKSTLLAWSLLILLATIWGSSFILIKKGLLGLTPQEVGSFRIVAASVVLLPFAILRLRSFPKKRLGYLLASGFLGSLLPSFLFAVAQTQLESAITGVLNGLVPIFTILIALVLFNQKQRPKVYLGVAIGFIGTAILVTANGKSFSGINIYALLVVLATLCYASNLNLIKQKLNNIHPVTVTSGSLALVGPLSIVFLFGFTDYWNKFLKVEGILEASFYIALLGIFGTAFALVIFNKILQMTDPLFASSVTYIIPIVAVVWGILDGEHIYFVQYIGMVAVGVGVYIANGSRSGLKKNRK
ncbi:MAG: EamA family transporter [Bacteroidota bacterium]